MRRLARRGARRPPRAGRLALGLALALAAGAVRADPAVPEGAAARRAFPERVTAQTPAGASSLALTGTAVRERLFFDVYAVASYVDAEAGVDTPQELLDTPAARRLELLMLRRLPGPRMAEAMRESLERRDPARRYSAAIDRLDAYIRGRTVAAGERIRFEAGAGAPFRCTISGRDPIVVEDEGFARLVWSIYVGPAPITEAIKRGLTARLAGAGR